MHCFSLDCCFCLMHCAFIYDSDEKMDAPKQKRGQDTEPLNELNEDDRVEFSTGFVLERDGDVYSCS